MKTDSELQRAVEDELEFDPSVAESDIGVTAKNGVVTLLGTVGSYVEKWAAERAAERVSGVRALAKDLKVKLPGWDIRTDGEVAAAALHALLWDVEVPDERLKIEVENGEVTLMGEVDWNYQREAAESDVRRLTGVTFVRNEITIKPTVSPTKIKSKIEAALQRSAASEAKGITVKADGGKVTLEGVVHSWIEREEAERAAWAAPGVFSVQDNIAVQH